MDVLAVFTQRVFSTAMSSFRDFDMPSSTGKSGVNMYHASGFAGGGGGARHRSSRARPPAVSKQPTVSLDPIDPSLIGAIRPAVLAAMLVTVQLVTPWALQFAEFQSGNWDSMGFSDAALHAALATNDKLGGVTTDKRELPHLAQLAEWHFLTKVSSASPMPRVLRLWARFFTVLKSNGFARTILDTADANRIAEDPPAMRLVSVEELCQMLLAFSNPHVSQADARHAYTQTSVPVKYRDLFSVGVGKATWTVNVTPMGFRWSAWHQQATAMTVVIAGVVDKGYSWSTPAQSKSPPPYIEIHDKAGKLVAYCVVFIDNFIIISDNNFTRQRLVAGVVAQAKAVHLVWKYDFVNTSGDAPAHLLGLKFRRCGPHLMWHHAEDNIAGWRSGNILFPDGRLTHSAPDASITYRKKQIAAVIGVIIWDASAMLRPLAPLSSVIDILRRVAVEADSAHDAWGGTSTLSHAEYLRLHRAFVAVLSGDEAQITVPPTPKARRLYATDACLSGWGIVQLSPQGTAVQTWSGRWSRRERRFDIYMLELMVALRAIDLCPDDTECILAVDNTGAASSIRRTYSSVPEANFMLADSYASRALRSVPTHVVIVGTNDQAADEASRGDSNNAMRVFHCTSLLLKAAIPAFSKANVFSTRIPAPAC
jgi:hypothetical protein